MGPCGVSCLPRVFPKCLPIRRVIGRGAGDLINVPHRRSQKRVNRLQLGGRNRTTKYLLMILRALGLGSFTTARVFQLLLCLFEFVDVILQLRGVDFGALIEPDVIDRSCCGSGHGLCES
jgi:hypothetical protein